MIQIIPNDLKIDFLSKWKIAVGVELLIIALGIGSALVNGVHWGLDFAGGTEVQVHFTGGATVGEGEVREIVESVGIAEPTVVRFGEIGRDEFLIRFAGGSEGEDGKQGEIVDRIKKALGEKAGALEVDRVEYVGPKVGADLRRAGTKAMLLSWVLILLYVGMRFNMQFAPGGVVALIHDVLVTAAIWQLMGQAFDLQVLAALLAIIGYSINDTIVIFDRIREISASHTTQNLVEVTNKAVNVTLSRTILTSFLTLLSVLALLFFAGPVVFPFTATMAIGIAVGTYSSIYVASPVMLLMERWQRQRAARRNPGAGKQKARKAARA